MIIVTRFVKTNILDHELGKHYFNMLAERNKCSFQCSALSPSGLNWSTASLTRLLISGAEGWGSAFMTRDSTLNSCLIELLLFMLTLGLQISLFGDCNYFCHTFRHMFPLFLWET